MTAEDLKGVSTADIVKELKARFAETDAAKAELGFTVSLDAPLEAIVDSRSPRAGKTRNPISSLTQKIKHARNRGEMKLVKQYEAERAKLQAENVLLKKARRRKA